MPARVHLLPEPPHQPGLPRAQRRERRRGDDRTGTGAGHRQFNFDDDNFNLVRQRVLDICDGIERAGLNDLVIRCSNGIRADRCDRELLARMKEVGFRYIAFGADAGNDRMLEVVKKGETIADIEQAVAAATDLGYDVKLLFVVGTPYETWEDVEDKVRLSRRYPIQDAHFYNIIPYPGTELFDWLKENDLFLMDPEEYLNKVSRAREHPGVRDARAARRQTGRAL